MFDNLAGGGEALVGSLEFKPGLFPGVIRQWKMRPLVELTGEEAKKPRPLTEELVRDLRPDANWKAFSIPCPAEKEVTAEDWMEQLRRNGFGVGGGPIP